MNWLGLYASVRQFQEMTVTGIGPQVVKGFNKLKNVLNLNAWNTYFLFKQALQFCDSLIKYLFLKIIQVPTNTIIVRFKYYWFCFNLSVLKHYVFYVISNLWRINEASNILQVMKQFRTSESFDGNLHSLFRIFVKSLAICVCFQAINFVNMQIDLLFEVCSKLETITKRSKSYYDFENLMYPSQWST